MADVKLLRPQRLTDNPDGGGLATSTEVVDGQVNNLFDDISRIDRVNGELSLRKVFAQATTADTAVYSDVHAIVQAPPQDPRVSAVMFRTGSWSDERDDARSAVERYLDESVVTRMVPYDRQLQGQRTVLVYQRPEIALPEIGEVYVLKVEATNQREFIRVQKVDHALETFTDSNGDFLVRVITLTISQPLSQEFAGSQPNRFFVADSGRSVVRKTIVSDAARYKGVVQLAEDAQPGDVTIKVDSVFAQLIPSAMSEIPITDAPTSGAIKLVNATATQQFINAGTVGTLPMDIHLHTAAAVGMIIEMYPGGGIASDRWVEKPDGTFVHEMGVRAMAFQVSPSRNRITVTGTAGNTGISVRYVPAVRVSASALSTQSTVTLGNRGYVYVTTLRPVPSPGTVTVHYRALGRWYQLVDDGAGGLRGEEGVGSGAINYQTGAVQVTLGALPDVGSAVIYEWGGSTTYEVRETDPQIKVPAVELQLSAGNCEPGTLDLVWVAGGVARTASDDGAGVITGAASGFVNYATGDVVIRPALLPDANTEYTVDYSAATSVQETFNPTRSGSTVTLSLGVAPRPRSIQLSYGGSGYSPFGAFTANAALTDNGVGQLVDEAGTVVAGSIVDYMAGTVTFNPNFITQGKNLTRAPYINAYLSRSTSPSTTRYEVIRAGGMWPASTNNAPFEVGFVNGSAMLVRYKANAAVDTDRHDVFESKPLVVDLVPLVGNTIVPGGLLFSFGGDKFYERNGVLYRSLNHSNGSGSSAGTVDYAAGKATLTAWQGGASASSFDIEALLTEVAPLPVPVVHGRTPGSPLRPGTFYLQANRYRDGALISALADSNGNLSTGAMHGTVDVTTGVFAVAFGAWVLDSSLSSADKAEAWYDAANVGGDGYIWRPDEVVPGSITFNCVVQTSLPQDPDIIKVNPVRLPIDGRVQAIRPGDTLVIHDTQVQSLPNGLAAGQVITLARSGVNSVALYDQAGLGVPNTKFVFDSVGSTITMATPLDLAGFVQPLVALHTVEDMALCIDAQITGEVSLGQALTHGYTAGQAMVSSALILGDAQGRYEHAFTQATWTNVWSNALIGSAPASGAKYNDAQYPIQVLNRDAITQRWALIFTSSTAFNIVGEELGVIGTGTIAGGAAPANPATGQPYFSLAAAGFGSGWATGNVIRFNTVAAGGPIWIARTVRSGPASQQDDLVRLQLRWDKD